MRIDQSDARMEYETEFGRRTRENIIDPVIPIEVGDVVIIRLAPDDEPDQYLRGVVSRIPLVIDDFTERQNGAWAIVEVARQDADGNFTGEFEPERCFSRGLQIVGKEG